MYGNYINRNTIYLTGASSNKYAKSPYLNNNMNYTGISYNNNLSNRKHKNSYNNYLNMNNSSHSFFINNNIDNTYGNIYQRQVMQLPPNEQPLFYFFSRIYFYITIFFYGIISVTYTIIIFEKVKKWNKTPRI